MKKSLGFLALIVGLLLISLFLDSCSVGAVGTKTRPRKSMLKSVPPEQQSEPEEQPDNSTKKGSQEWSTAGEETAETTQNDDLVNVTNQKMVKGKVAVRLINFNNTPQSLKIPVINTVLSKEAPEKLTRKYKYRFVGDIKSFTDFPYTQYLTVKGQASGKYPGDALVVSPVNKKLYVFSNDLPDLHWFEIKE